MVEYFVTKGKLVVRNNEPLIVVDGEEKHFPKVNSFYGQALAFAIRKYIA